MKVVLLQKLNEDVIVAMEWKIVQSDLFFAFCEKLKLLGCVVDHGQFELKLLFSIPWSYESGHQQPPCLEAPYARHLKL